MKNLHNITPLPDIPDDIKIALIAWYRRSAVFGTKQAKYVNGRWFQHLPHGWRQFDPVKYGWYDEGLSNEYKSSEFTQDMIIIGEQSV